MVNGLTRIVTCRPVSFGELIDSLITVMSLGDCLLE
jgi:hypothetical protein